MKTRIFFLIGLSLALAACNQVTLDDDAGLSQKKAETPMSTFDVSYQTLLDLLSVPSTNVAPKLVASIEPITHAEDTLMYLVTFQDDKGWSLIAADKRLPVTLAEGDQGSLDLDNLPPGLVIWLDDIANRVYELKQTTDLDETSDNYKVWLRFEAYSDHLAGKSPRRILDKDALPIDDVKGYWELVGVTTTALTPITVGPLIQTKWGQSSPWNSCVPYTNSNYTTRCPAGCVAVAGAQMAYFLHYALGKPVTAPASGVCYGYSSDNSSSYSFNFSNFGSTVWDNMATRTWETNTDLSAYLIGYVGMSIDMDYEEGGSGASMSDLRSFLSGQGIGSSSQSYNSSTVLSSLNSGRPVIVSANRKYYTTFLGIRIPHYTGHAWIIDGYEADRTKYTYTYEWVYSGNSNTPIPYVENRVTESISTTNHALIMNWGYSGSYDGNRYTITGDWKTSSDRNYLYDREIISIFTAN